jgi:hypothetical protein
VISRAANDVAVIQTKPNQTKPIQPHDFQLQKQPGVKNPLVSGN